MIFADIESPIGLLRIVEDEGALRSLDTVKHRTFDTRPCGEPGQSALLKRCARQLEEYFAGARATFDLPLRLEGTAFQQRVWQALLTIPFGETRSYAEQARAIGRPTATRAVGAANGRNPISIIVPCHRVIGSDGSLTGYAGGEPTKRWLLTHEGGTARGPQLDSWQAVANP
ncbi:MAG TPA: methylated-DNA--[protein]-cysteine S-methyltransferase [Polyangia bacterium]|jgi:methylated-DNA-[protein]-cysteine S-methyltransferase